MTGDDQTPLDLLGSIHAQLVINTGTVRDKRTCSIPQTQLHQLVVDAKVMHKVLKHRGLAESIVDMSI